MDKDKAMALFHARNAVLRALREFDIAQFEVEGVGYSPAFFPRTRIDLEKLAGHLHSSAHKEWRRREGGEFVGRFS